MLLKEGHL
jgi:hypothetical protein